MYEYLNEEFTETRERETDISFPPFEHAAHNGKSALPGQSAAAKNKGMFASYPEILNVRDLMKMLKIGRNNAYSLLASGKIKTIRVGRRYVIPKKCVISYIKSNS